MRMLKFRHQICLNHVKRRVAEETSYCREQEQGEPCHYEKVGDRYVVYRTRDRKVMKSINYFKPDLSQFFTSDELAQFHNAGTII